MSTSNLVSDVMSLVEENKTLKTDIAALRDEKAALKSDRDALKSEVKNLRDDKTGLEKELTGLEKEIKSLKKDSKNLEDENYALKNAVAHLRKSIEEAGKSLIALASDNSANFKDIPEEPVKKKEKPAPEVKEEAKEEPKSKEEEVPEEPVKKMVRAKKEESRYGIFPYSNDIFQMGKMEFTFTFFSIVFKKKDERRDLMVVPLNMKQKNPPLLVWAINSTETRAFVVSTGAVNKEINLFGYNVYLTGWMEGPEFKATVTTDEPADIGVPQENGSNGHLYIPFQDMHIHICPVSFKNNDEQYADFIYAIEKDGRFVKCGDNAQEHVYFTDSFGTTQEIMAKWKDGALIGAVLPQAENAGV